MPAVSKAIFTDTIVAAGTISEHQAVGWDGDVASAAGAIAGFACTDAVSGDQLAIDQLGTAVAIAGEQLAAGAALEVGSAGKLVALDAGVKVAHAVTAAGGDGDVFEVFIIPN